MPTPAASLDAIIATKADLEDLATKEDLTAAVASLRADLGSAVNLLMGELGKVKAGQEEQNKILAHIVQKLDGVK